MLPFRMLCMQCLHLDEPDTVLDGSDRAELIAWCCFVIPGLVYCWVRHLRRTKVCGACGSANLMRESRAATARRRGQPSSREPQLLSLGGDDFSWPAPLESPRARMRIGSVGAALCGFSVLAWLIALLDPAPAVPAFETASLSWLLVTVWLGRQFQLITRDRVVSTGGCEAWDAQGRSLNIERI